MPLAAPVIKHFARLRSRIATPVAAEPYCSRAGTLRVMRGPEPRVAPGDRAQLGWRNFVVTRVLAAATDGRPPNIFTTLGRHRRLFRRWLRFAAALMPGGQLPRIDSELVILRVAHNCECDYEWQHHERLGRLAGLSAPEVERVRQGPDTEGWTRRQVLLLRAADALHRQRDVPDDLWASLRAELSDTDLIELCLLVGHYEMLAMTLNALRVQPDAPPTGRRSRALRVVQRLSTRGPRDLPKDGITYRNV
jgi:alkylhydroperoxidase family enzyme